MSKITAKNLQYNSSLPPFLARLRGEAAGDPNGPDPILAAHRRPTKKRSGSAEAEDAPLVVDERGNVVDVSVSADGTVKEQEPSEGTVVVAEATNHSPDGDKPTDGDAAAAAAAGGEKLADATSQRKKRKVGRVVGADAEEDDLDGRNGKKRGPETDKSKERDDSAAAGKPKGKKKAKKIKLSFGDDEG
jgi:hypothetical protein